MRKLLDEKSISRSIIRISHEIIEKNKGSDNIVLIGIKTRGIYLARRICEEIKRFEDKTLNVGELDISLYRDDLQTISEEPTINGSKIDFDIKNKVIILIDDVLYTGRTIRSALDALIDIARPKSIQLAVLVDRGHRELPIRPDYVGKNIPTSRDEIIHVNLKEIDDVEDSVTITKKSN